MCVLLARKRTPAATRFVWQQAAFVEERPGLRPLVGTLCGNPQRSVTHAIPLKAPAYRWDRCDPWPVQTRETPVPKSGTRATTKPYEGERLMNMLLLITRLLLALVFGVA